MLHYSMFADTVMLRTQKTTKAECGVRVKPAAVVGKLALVECPTCRAKLEQELSLFEVAVAQNPEMAVLRNDFRARLGIED